jgi:alpha-ketoglutaric semialdehyde dehydrogenase
MITGKNYIGDKLSSESTETFKAFVPKTLEYLQDEFYSASPEEVNEAVKLSEEAFVTYGKLSQKRRAEFLNAIADEILNLGDSLLVCASNESGLPTARFQGERGRTVNQLRTFANLLEEGSWVEASIDTAIPDREPIPKPDVRKYLVALGPVAVFGASNFPLAFSTAGGDTASALAAGCTVIVKSHPAHPGTGELVASAIIKAAEKTGMPNGVFSNLNGNGFEVGVQLVEHPGIKAVGFTGSLRGGRALFDLANKRETPIPVYAEMGSINPVVLLNSALSERAESVAQDYAASINLGVGQFCTNPGLILAVDSPELNKFIEHFSTAVGKLDPATMLTKGIAETFRTSKNDAIKQEGVSLEASSKENSNELESEPTLASCTGKSFISNPKLHNEIFGPYSIVVKCENSDELLEAAKSLEGQLSATLVGEKSELSNNKQLINILKEKVGRVVFNGVPTGTEVCASMQHGGPYPATSNSNSTSVGSGAIKRFVRPICFQDFPEDVLPDELKDGNPLNIWRLIDNNFTKDSI